jgi:ubiquinone/menaquinone biosynthesis C-methylase UbiE
MSQRGTEDSGLWNYYQLENPEVYSGTHDRHRKVFSMVEKLIHLRSKVIEIGFGDGYLLSLLQEKYETFGADISQEIIDNVSKKIPKVLFKTIGVDGDLPFPDSYFDGFIASEVLEHMTDAELKKCTEEIHRVLKQGGIAVLTFPAEENLKESECYCPACGNIFHRWGHKQYWNEQLIADRFRVFSGIKTHDFFVRFEGRNISENVVGYIMYILRCFVNKILFKLPGRSFMVILKK